MVLAGLAVRFLNAPKLRAMMHKLGVNGGVPIDLEVGAGTCRVPSSKENLARAAAGFGAGSLTPLEAAYMMAVIANNGRRPSLDLVDHIVTADGKRLAVPTESVGASRAIRTSTARRLRRMLEVTVREGTASKSFRDRRGNRYLGHYGGAGKTGTLSRGNPRRLFSWYAGYAPANNPEVAVAVMLANEHRWWRKGAEVGRDVLRAYFARKNIRGITHPIRGASARKKKK